MDVVLSLARCLIGREECLTAADMGGRAVGLWRIVVDLLKPLVCVGAYSSPAMWRTALSSPMGVQAIRSFCEGHGVCSAPGSWTLRSLLLTTTSEQATGDRDVSVVWNGTGHHISSKPISKLRARLKVRSTFSPQRLSEFVTLSAQSFTIWNRSIHCALDNLAYTSASDQLPSLVYTHYPTRSRSSTANVPASKVTDHPKRLPFCFSGA